MVDTCSTCDQLKRDMEVAHGAKDAAKRSELRTQKLRLIKSNAACSIMDASLCGIAVDLQQTLVTLRLYI